MLFILLDCVLLKVVAVVNEVVVATQLSLSWVEANNAGVTALFINTNSEVEKPTDVRVSLPSIILADLFGNKSLHQRVQKVMLCDL